MVSFVLSLSSSMRSTSISPSCHSDPWQSLGSKSSMVGFGWLMMGEGKVVARGGAGVGLVV